MTAYDHLESLISRYPSLGVCRGAVADAYEALAETFASGGKLLIAGNGGSASDAEHIVGELMKSFILPRPLSREMKDTLKRIDPAMGEEIAGTLQTGLPTIALDGHIALSTAFQNDCAPDMVFAQQVAGYGAAGDSFLGISTSGNSRNVLLAAVTAKAIGLKVIGLTGKRECKLQKLADICICVPETETFKIQELHLPVYHCICMMLEERFFGEK